MKRVLIALALAGALTNCAAVPVSAVLAGVAAAATTYCTVTSQAGKEAIRDVLTAGQKVLACQEPVRD